MGIALSFHSSRSYARILPEVDSGASWFVDDPPRNVSIAPATDWTFLIVRLSGDDRPWIHSELFPLSNTVPS